MGEEVQGLGHGRGINISPKYSTTSYSTKGVIKKSMPQNQVQALLSVQLQSTITQGKQQLKLPRTFQKVKNGSHFNMKEAHFYIKIDLIQKPT